ncbi:MAG: hypothetical protein ABWY06_04445 [Pseudomonas sp.]|uniref:hypothetical protein n=1 Tax=Pseudomonas sp. TaxID=306 RepID=UPI0033989024
MAVKRPRYSEEDLPTPGSLYFLPLDDGRVGIARVVSRITAVDPVLSTLTRPVWTSRVLVVPSSWVGVEAQRPADEDILRQLVLTHHSWCEEPQATWIAEPPPGDFIAAGRLDITEQDALIEGEDYGDWASLCLQPLLQWRWEHDRDNLLREENEEELRIEESARLHSERQAEILRTLTLDSLATRPWFEHWDDAWEAPFRQQAEGLILAFVQTLRALPKLSKVVVRRELRHCVEAFNTLEAAKAFIQTTHREDIDEALDLVVSVVRYPELMDSVDEWREW